MKVIIAGGRDITNYDLLCDAIKESGFNITHIIHGGAAGADRLGQRYAEENRIPQTRFMANWNEHGRAAGPIRNSEMVNFVKKDGEAGIILLWDGKSRGTFDCLKKAHAAGLTVYVKMTTAVTKS